MKKLYNAASSFEAINISNMLTSSGIENKIDEPFSLRSANLSTSTDINGINIYVKEDDESSAKELLDEYLLRAKNESLLDDYKRPWYLNPKVKRIFAWFFLIVIMIFFFLIFYNG